MAGGAAYGFKSFELQMSLMGKSNIEQSSSLLVANLVNDSKRKITPQLSGISKQGLNKQKTKKGYSLDLESD